VKRGLAVLNREETSPADFTARVEALRGKLRDDGAAVGLIYGDVSRSGDLGYLTNLCLYWNEAILAVPVNGEPALITKLSKRIQPWMKRTTVLGDIRSGAKMAENVGKFLDDRFCARDQKISIVDMRWWPSELVDDLRHSLSTCTFNEMNGPVREQRLAPSNVELKLLQHAAALVDDSIEEAWSEGKDADGRTGSAVRSIRMAGFQDAQVTSRSLPDGSEYIDVIGQYRYVWVRTSSARGGAMADSANRALSAVMKQIKPHVTGEQLASVAAEAVNGKYEHVFSCIPHSDIETRGLFRMRDDAKRPLKRNEVIAINLSLANGEAVLCAAESLRVTQTGVELLRQAVRSARS
jgi:Xaa-Pro aminopeptidase